MVKSDIMRGSFLEIRELNIDEPNMTIFDLIRQMQYEVIYSMGSQIFKPFLFNSFSLSFIYLFESLKDLNPLLKTRLTLFKNEKSCIT